MTRQWKIGEPCFITHISVGTSHAQMRVMPAIVTHVGNVAGTQAVATSFSTDDFGRQLIEGEPYASEKEAREYLTGYASRVAKAANDAPLKGMQPGWHIPENIPQNGDTIYVVDVGSKEIIEAKVGIVRLQGHRVEVGYDTSPGNPEASIVKAKQYYTTLAGAKASVKEQYNESYTFVSHTELAERTNKAIEQVFTDAIEHIKSPKFKVGLGELAKELHRDATT